ncbi:MAG: hypothetical protein R2789_18465 [Microthrixaceae bacterium]
MVPSWLWRTPGSSTLERALCAEFDKIGNLAGRRFLHRNDGFDLGERAYLLGEETVPGQI